jgi:CDP-diacylglycerol--glycerol-3-phosphate 3-phosphatidyltransferase
MKSQAKLRLVTFLTAARFPLVLLFFVGAVLYTRPALRHGWLYALVLGALIAAAATDLADGYLARRFRVVTRLGAHVDPLMDKFFYLASLPLLVFVAMLKPDNLVHGTILLVLTLLFLARDQWVTFLRSIGSLYDASGRAHWSGKLRTAVNFPLICLIYHFEEAPASLQFLGPWTLYALETIAVLINGLSIVTYTRNYWPYLRKSAQISGPAESDT